jgi:hypothetical protein
VGKRSAGDKHTAFLGGGRKTALLAKTASRNSVAGAAPPAPGPGSTGPKTKQLQALRGVGFSTTTDACNYKFQSFAKLTSRPAQAQLKAWRSGLWHRQNLTPRPRGAYAQV